MYLDKRSTNTNNQNERTTQRGKIMISFFKKKDNPITETQIKKYDVTIIFGSEHDLQYKFTNVIAENADDAVNQMKQYVAQNGFFGTMTHEEIISKLSAIEVKEI